MEATSSLQAQSTNMRLDDHGQELLEMMQECLRDYFPSGRGAVDLARYEAARTVALANFAEINAAEQRGEDVCDAVLLKLLPHCNFAGNRERGAWIHIAPVIKKGVKSWLDSPENSYRRHRPDDETRDWQATSREILRFIRNCVADPANLVSACQEFSASEHTQMMQSGFMTPILNALKPDAFLLINSKPCRAINYFAGTRYGTKLTDYPQINAAGWELIRAVEPLLTDSIVSDKRPCDVFDHFTHWLLAVKKFAYGKEKPEAEESDGNAEDQEEVDSRAVGVQYWKIAPGRNAWQWDECQVKGFIGVGWGELGDCSGLSRDEFLKKRVELAKTDPEFETASTQVWQFANRVRVGDRILANRGANEIMGIGTVTGPYRFVSGERHPHQLPVAWDEIQPFRVARMPWVKTVTRLKPQDFERLISHQAQNQIVPSIQPAFSAEAFDLLDGLKANPTKTFYDEHKAELRQYVQLPVKNLFDQVMERLPQTLLDQMERKRPFSLMLKNDYGRGGAYNWCWTAMYPKAGERTTDAQLYISITTGFFNYGFTFGDYAKDAITRFRHNIEKNRDEIARLLAAVLSDLPITYGGSGEKAPEEKLASGESARTFEDWVNDIGKFTSDLRIQMTPDEVFATDREVLASRIAMAFTALFPLVIISTSDDTMTHVTEWVSLQAASAEPNSRMAGTKSKDQLYTLSDLVRETSYPEAQLRRWIGAIERKKQAVIYGPPGTGKTYLAERLARYFVARGNGLMELIQFHPSYAYEEFIEGLRPRVTEDDKLTYEWQRGRFVQFCSNAEKCSGTCVLVIDEINRANLAAVFGELMYLLEYRDRKIPLPSGERFSIPPNVMVIGTMNTADRSIALVDHALRRRFAFLNLSADYDLLRKQAVSEDFYVEGIVQTLTRINAAIDDPNYSIGPSYFLNAHSAAELQDVWQFEIEPYLEEIFYGQRQRMEDFRWERIRPALLFAEAQPQVSF